MRALLLGSSLLLVGCGLIRPTFTCPTGLHPCGTGCIPTNAVCCDDGTAKTSSYCTNGAAGCFANDRDCAAVFPAGQRGAFCCGESGNIGSNDCPSGERHCGLLCQPTSQPCCPADAGVADCPEASWDDAACKSVGGVVCGVCATSGKCISCPRGSCCQAGVVCGEAGAACIPGPACDPTSGGTGGGGGSSCPPNRNPCGSSGGMQTVEVYWPKGCACPTGTTDKGGSLSNELCGLSGSGHDCHACACQ